MAARFGYSPKDHSFKNQRKRDLQDAADRLERFMLSDDPTDEEYEVYMCGDGQYQADIALLVKLARDVLTGLKWDNDKLER